MRAATAATAQLEQAKRMIDEDERELAAIGARLQESNRAVSDRERVAGELEVAHLVDDARVGAHSASAGSSTKLFTVRRKSAACAPSTAR